MDSAASFQGSISKLAGMDVFSSKTLIRRTTQSHKNGEQLLFCINLSKILSVANNQADNELITDRPLNTRSIRMTEKLLPACIFLSEQPRNLEAHC